MSFTSDKFNAIATLYNNNLNSGLPEYYMLQTMNRGGARLSTQNLYHHFRDTIVYDASSTSTKLAVIKRKDTSLSTTTEWEITLDSGITVNQYGFK